MNKKILTFFIISTLILVFGITFFMQLNTRDLSVIKTAEGEPQSFAVYTKDGDILYTDKINNFTVNNSVGIIENPPLASITDIYGKALASMGDNKNVLIMYIDGLGYEIYEKALKTGIIPYISSLGTAKKALTVYPPITDVTFASMVTGTTPKYTGIHNRDKKPMPVHTMFDIATQKGKSSKVIEGNIKILTDKVDTILNIDENKNGTIDDEIYEKAMEEIQNPPHILLVHFHSYDDFGHKYGPSSQEALEQLKVLDSYIEDIMKDYQGDVIITSDHGMHDEADGGSHGIFSSSDLFIPMITKNH
ncbi:MAG: alkaline phosphatase family protein [Lutispora sp.]